MDKVFRLQNNVPEIYVNESRDFQLLCRLKDVVFGGVKYNIDSLNHTSNTLEMNAALLPLLKSKVGFFAYEELTEEELRYLLAGFPDMLKYKGSERAIKKAVCLWFRVNRLGGKLVGITIDNENYQIDIMINSEYMDTKLLDVLFKYILPAGYIVTYNFASDNYGTQSYHFEQSYEGINIHNKVNSNIKTKYDNDLENRLVGTVGFTEIMSATDYNDPKSDVNTIYSIPDGKEIKDEE